jgi:iron complex outermembrane receptor protein
VNFSAGLHGGYFTRDHFMDVVGGSRAYSNNGTKEEGDAFAKLLYDAGPWHLYGDAQVRWAHFHYTGDVDLGSISWTFFNPKIGARRDLGKGVSVYASLGKATREPSRNDMLAGEDNATIPYDLSAVKPEEVVDFETGVRYAAPGFDLQADLYAMQFTNEIALEGELSAIGLPLRRNVDSSYRRGLEVDLGVQLADPLHLRCTANVSTNEISSWTQFYDVYDPSGNYVKSVSRDYANVEPLLTPPVTLNAALDWKPASDALLGLAARYVSASHLDNTGNSDFTTPSYFDLDASAIIGLEWWIKAGTPRVRVQVNNIFDNRRIWPSGYDYVYFQKDGSGGTSLQGLSYYYPLATRTFFVGLEFHL